MGYSWLDADLRPMQIATIALVCLVSVGAVAVAAAEQTSPPPHARLAQTSPQPDAPVQGPRGPDPRSHDPQAQDAPKPPAGSPAYPPAPPPNETGPLALPHLGPSEPDHARQPQNAAAPAARPQDQPRAPRTDSARRSDPPRGRTCFSQSETREKISAHRLADPFRALRAGHIQGDALRARLCRWRQDEFVYEISVLRRDGRITHIYMNASTGQAVQMSNDIDRK